MIYRPFEVKSSIMFKNTQQNGLQVHRLFVQLAVDAKCNDSTLLFVFLDFF